MPQEGATSSFRDVASFSLIGSDLRDAPALFSAGRNLGARSRVLVVEDEWFIAVEIEEELREAGFDVLGPFATVSDALKAISAAAMDGGIAAAVLDINLCGEQVTPVADALTAMGVPFAYLTGYPHDVDRGGYDAAPLLQKPLDRKYLLKALSVRTVLAEGNRAGPDTGKQE